jgi:hypothetical protein
MPDSSEIAEDIIFVAHALYGDRLVGNLSQKIEKSIDVIARRREECDALRTQLEEAMLDLERLKAHERASKYRLDTTLGTIAEEIYLVYQLPDVTEVKVMQGRVHIFTNVLFNHDETTGHLHQLGRFRIDLCPCADADEDLLRVYNLDIAIKFEDTVLAAPRFRADGRLRVGDASGAPLPEDITDSIKHLRFSHAIENTIGLLSESFSTAAELEALGAFPMVNG